MLGQDIAGKIAPDMVAAKTLALFDKDNLELRTHLGKSERNKPARKPATNYGQIAFDIFEIHFPALAQPFSEGKAPARKMHSFISQEILARRMQAYL